MSRRGAPAARALGAALWCWLLLGARPGRRPLGPGRPSSAFSPPARAGRGVSAARLACEKEAPCGGAPAEAPCSKAGGTPAVVQASKGTRVRADFQLTRDDDGSVVDSSEVKGPLQFVIGAGQVMPGVDTGVLGMAVGETRPIKLGTETFGEHDKSKLRSVPMSNMPPEAAVGTQMTVPMPAGQVAATVVQMDAVDKQGERVAILDFNHPFAGKSFTMTLTLLSCEEAGPEGSSSCGCCP